MRSGLCKSSPGDVEADADVIGCPWVESWGNCCKWCGKEGAVLLPVSWLLLLLVLLANDWNPWNGPRLEVETIVGSAEEFVRDEDDLNPNCAPAMLESFLKWSFSRVDMGWVG